MKALPYILIGAACFALGWFVRPAVKQPEVKTDTIQMPPIVVTQTKTDTLLMLSPLPYIAWLPGDTIEVDGYKHQKEANMYTDDSTYTAWVSGVRPSLDSIRTYRHTQYVDRYIYRNIVRQERKKRWGVGLQAGVGCPIGWYVGVGVSYDLWQW